MTLLETVIVLEGRRGEASGADLELFVFEAGIEVVPFDRRQAEASIRGWRKFGKGRHPARLNLGDCCTYGLAKATGEPVLAKGTDFPLTDIRSVTLGEAS